MNSVQRPIPLTYYSHWHTEAQLTQDIVRSYYNNKQNDELFKFFDRMEKKYAKQDQVMGNLLFYNAYVYKFIKDFKQAKACFTSARKYFAKSLEKDIDVFALIDKELEELQIIYFYRIFSDGVRSYHRQY